MKPFAIDVLLEQARQRTGLADFGPPDFLEGLRVLLDSLNAQGQVTESRWDHVNERLLRLLENRLWFARDLHEYPEIAREDIGSPVFIVSLPRTGSTKMHRLLSASGDFQTLPFWKVHKFARIPGEPDGGRARRISETEAFEQWMYHLSPDILTGHPMFTHEAEEDQWLGEATFRQAFIAGLYDVPGYGEWFMQADPMPVYHYFAQQLQYLQWQFKPPQPMPWLLKSPNHLGNEQYLVKAFHNPRFIVTHRDPIYCVPSITMTALAMRRLYLPGADANVLGPVLTGLVAFMAAYHVKWRAEHPEIDMLDLSFNDVTHDGIGSARRVYDFCGLEWNADAERRMRDWERDNKQNKHGKNNYSLEMVGVTEESIRTAFAPYLERYSAFI